METKQVETIGTTAGQIWQYLDKKGESTLAKMSKDLDYVDLYAKARKYSFDKGYLVLEYGFINSEDIKKSQDDVF